MKTRLHKEFRLLLPACLLTVVLPWLPLALFPSDPTKGLSILLSVISCAIVGASVFGPEFSHQTMGQLLSQPIRRNRIWFEKMLALALALIPASLALLWVAVFDHRSTSRWELNNYLLGLVPICVFCTTPCLTILTRSAIGAVVFSLAIPFLLILGGSSLAEYFLRSRDWSSVLPAAVLSSEDTLIIACVAALVAAYSVASYVHGYFSFKHLQVAEVSSESLAFGKTADAWFASAVRRMFPHRAGAAWSLVQKEIRLQQTTFALAVMFCLMELLALAYVRWSETNDGEIYLFVPWLVYACVIPILTGALSMAEERSIGVHGWQLTQPVSTFQQWRIKVGVTYLISLTLGVLWPAAVLLFISPYFTSIDRAPGFHQEVIQFLKMPLWCVLEILITTVAIFASSVSSNTLRAAILSAGLSVGGIFILRGAVDVMTRVFFGSMAGFESAIESVPMRWGVVPLLLVAAMLAGLLLWFSFVNYRRLQASRRQVALQLLAVVVPLVLSLLWIGVLVLLARI